MQRNPRIGIEQRQNPGNGLTVIRLHYTADPVKRTPEWKAETSRNLHPRTWRREYEIDWASPEGEPVVPEYQEGTHCRMFEWDPTLRCLRFWDFGFVSPVVLFGQLTVFGQLRIRRELCPFNTPLDQLMDAVSAVTVELGGRDLSLQTDTWDVGGAEQPEGAPTFDAGDPAGTNQTDLGASAEVLGRAGIMLHTTRPGTELSYAGLRKRFLRQVMEPGVGPVPAIVMHPECPNLRSALGGAFHLGSLPPHRPVKTHPEKDLVDALRYGEDNIRSLVQAPSNFLRRMATEDQREMRSATNEADESWVARQRRLWQAIVEGS
jgi:hypothetical protein